MTAQSRLTVRAIEQLRDRLSDRDMVVLRSVGEHRFLSTRHVERLHFVDHATPLAAARICRRTLQRLYEQRVLHRLERRVGGIRAGSASYVWSVGVAGDRLLHASNRGPRQHQDEPSVTFLKHTLAVAEAHVALIEATRTGIFELTAVELEPASWRRFVTSSGADDTLRPDLYAVTASVDYEDHWFIEVDCGTESLPVLLRKCQQYESYRRSGQAQAALGAFPLVVFQLPTATRQRKFAEAIAAARDIDAAIFRLVTTEELVDLITSPDHYVIRKEVTP
jgi:hypothetical protein